MEFHCYVPFRKTSLFWGSRSTDANEMNVANDGYLSMFLVYMEKKIYSLDEQVYHWIGILKTFVSVWKVVRFRKSISGYVMEIRTVDARVDVRTEYLRLVNRCSIRRLPSPTLYLSGKLLRKVTISSKISPVSWRNAEIFACRPPPALR